MSDYIEPRHIPVLHMVNDRVEAGHRFDLTIAFDETGKIVLIGDDQVNESTMATGPQGNKEVAETLRLIARRIERLDE